MLFVLSCCRGGAGYAYIRTYPQYDAGRIDLVLCSRLTTNKIKKIHFMPSLGFHFARVCVYTFCPFILWVCVVCVHRLRRRTFWLLAHVFVVRRRVVDDDDNEQ